MDNEKQAKMNVTNHFHAPVGQYIDHVDTIHFHMDGDGTFHFGMVEKADALKEEEEQPDSQRNHDDELTKELLPIFYNNQDDVELFLKQVRGMQDKDITDLVNRWVKDKRISDYGNSRKGDLWSILNRAGLYTKSKQNWNMRVD